MGLRDAAKRIRRIRQLVEELLAQNSIRPTGPRLVKLKSNQSWSVRARSESSRSVYCPGLNSITGSPGDERTERRDLSLDANERRDSLTARDSGARFEPTPPQPASPIF